MADELITLAKELDLCWLERRFDDLAAFFADDVVFVAPGGEHRAQGREAAVASYREFMGRSEIKSFQASDHVVTEAGSGAVVEYRWDMAWSGQGPSQELSGQEIFVLGRFPAGRQVIWRIQLPS
jgi:ketosteroid isomerase-like protein